MGRVWPKKVKLASGSRAGVHRFKEPSIGLADSQQGSTFAAEMVKPGVKIRGYKNNPQAIWLHEALAANTAYIKTFTEAKDEWSYEHWLKKEFVISIMYGGSGIGKTLRLEALLDYLAKNEVECANYPGGVYFLDFRSLCRVDDKNKNFLVQSQKDLLADLISRTFSLRNDTSQALETNLNAWFKSQPPSLFIYENITSEKFKLLKKLLFTSQNIQAHKIIVSTDSEACMKKMVKELEVYFIKQISTKKITSFTEASSIKAFLQKLDNYDENKGLGFKSFAQLEVSDEQLLQLGKSLQHWPVLIKLFYYSYRAILNESKVNSTKLWDNLLVAIAPNSNMGRSQFIANLIKYNLQQIGGGIIDRKLLPELLAYISYGDNNALSKRLIFGNTDFVWTFKRFGLIQADDDGNIRVHNTIQEQIRICIEDKDWVIELGIDSGVVVFELFVGKVYSKFRELLEITHVQQQDNASLDYLNLGFSTPLNDFDEIMLHAQALFNHIRPKKITEFQSNTLRKIIFVKAYMAIIFYFKGLYELAKETIESICKEFYDLSTDDSSDSVKSAMLNAVNVILGVFKKQEAQDKNLDKTREFFNEAEFFNLNVLAFLINAHINKYGNVKQLSNNELDVREELVLKRLLKQGGTENQLDAEICLQAGIACNVFALLLVEYEEHDFYPLSIQNKRAIFTSFLKNYPKYKGFDIVEQLFKVAYVLKTKHLKFIKEKFAEERPELMRRAEAELAITQLGWGISLTVRNKYGKALEKYFTAISSLEKVYENDGGYYLAVAYRYRGELYRRLGLYSEAQKELGRAAEILQRSFHVYHKELVRCSMDKLKTIYLSQQGLKAQTEIEKMLADGRNFIQCDPDKIEINLYYVRTLITQGRHQAADSALEKCWQALSELKLQSSFYDEAIKKLVSYVGNTIYYSRLAGRILHYQGLNFYKQGRYFDAKVLYIGALKIELFWLMKKLPGNPQQGIIQFAVAKLQERSSGKLVQTLRELANVYYRDNDFAKAKSLLEDIKQVQKLMYLEDYQLYVRQRNSKLPIGGDDVPIQEPTGVDDLPIQEVHITKHCLARVFIAQGQYKQAKKEIVNLPQSEIHIRANYDITSIHYTQAKLKYLKGDLVTAHEQISQAKAQFKQLNKNINKDEHKQINPVKLQAKYTENIQYIRLLRLEALILLNLKDYTAAKSSLIEGLRNIIKLFPHQHPETIMLYWNLGDVYVAMRKYKQAYTAYCNADDLIQMSLGPVYYNHPKRTQLLLRYGWYYVQLGLSNLTAETANSNYGIDCLLRAKRIYQKCYEDSEKHNWKYDRLSLELLLAYVNALLQSYLDEASLAKLACDYLQKFRKGIVEQAQGIYWHPSWIYIITQGIEVNENTRDIQSFRIQIEQDRFPVVFKTNYLELLNFIKKNAPNLDKENNQILENYIAGIQLAESKKISKQLPLMHMDKNVFKACLKQLLAIRPVEKTKDGNFFPYCITMLQNEVNPQQVIAKLAGINFNDKEKSILQYILLGLSYAFLGYYHTTAYYAVILKKLLNEVNNPNNKDKALAEQFQKYLEALSRYYTKSSYSNSEEGWDPKAVLESLLRELDENFIFFRLLIELTLAEIKTASLDKSVLNANNESLAKLNEHLASVSVILEQHKNLNNWYGYVAFEKAAYKVENEICFAEAVVTSDLLLGRNLLAKLKHSFNPQNVLFDFMQARLVNDTLYQLKKVYGEHSLHRDMLLAYVLQGRYLIYRGDYKQAEVALLNAIDGYQKHYKLREDQLDSLVNLREAERWLLVCYLLSANYIKLRRYTSELLMRIEVHSRDRKEVYADIAGAKVKDEYKDAIDAYKKFYYYLVRVFKLAADISNSDMDELSALQQGIKQVQTYLQDAREYKQHPSLKNTPDINLDYLKSLYVIVKRLYVLKFGEVNKDNKFFAKNSDFNSIEQVCLVNARLNVYQAFYNILTGMLLIKNEQFPKKGKFSLKKSKAVASKKLFSYFEQASEIYKETYANLYKFHPKSYELVYLINLCIISAKKNGVKISQELFAAIELYQTYCKFFLADYGLDVAQIEVMFGFLAKVNWQKIIDTQAAHTILNNLNVAELVASMIEFGEAKIKTKPGSIVHMISSDSLSAIYGVPKTTEAYVETEYSRTLSNSLKSAQAGVKIYVISAPSGYGKTELANYAVNKLADNTALLCRLVYSSRDALGDNSIEGIANKVNNAYLDMLYKLGFRGANAIIEFQLFLFEQKQRMILILDNFPHSTTLEELKALLYPYLIFKNAATVNLDIIITTQDTNLARRLKQFYNLLTSYITYFNIESGLEYKEAKNLLAKRIGAGKLNKATLNSLVEAIPYVPIFLEQVASFINNSINTIPNETQLNEHYRQLTKDPSGVAFLIENEKVTELFATYWQELKDAEKHIYKLIALINYYNIPEQVVNQLCVTILNKQQLGSDFLKKCSFIKYETDNQIDNSLKIHESIHNIFYKLLKAELEQLVNNDLKDESFKIPDRKSSLLQIEPVSYSMVVASSPEANMYIANPRDLFLQTKMVDSKEVIYKQLEPYLKIINDTFRAKDLMVPSDLAKDQFRTHFKALLRKLEDLNIHQLEQKEIGRLYGNLGLIYMNNFWSTSNSKYKELGSHCLEWAYNICSNEKCFGPRSITTIVQLANWINLKQTNQQLDELRAIRKLFTENEVKGEIAEMLIINDYNILRVVKHDLKSLKEELAEARKTVINSDLSSEQKFLRSAYIDTCEAQALWNLQENTAVNFFKIYQIVNSAVLCFKESVFFASIKENTNRYIVYLRATIIRSLCLLGLINKQKNDSLPVDIKVQIEANIKNENDAITHYKSCYSEMQAISKVRIDELNSYTKSFEQLVSHNVKSIERGLSLSPVNSFWGLNLPNSLESGSKNDDVEVTQEAPKPNT